MATRTLALLLMCCACHVLASSPITITRSTTYQTLEGFGALGAMKAWSDAPPYFDTNFVNLVLGDLGLTIIRDEIPTDFEVANADTLSTTINWANYRLNGEIGKHFTYLRALKQKADGLGRPLKLLTTVFSPPAWMKTNNDVNNGGSLRPTLYNDFAKCCEAYIRAIKDSTGIDVYCMSLQNEPSISRATPTCVYTGAQLADLVKRVGARLRAASLTTRLTFHDDFFVGAGMPVLTPMVNDSAALAEAAFISTHVDGSTQLASLGGTWGNFSGQLRGKGKIQWLSSTYGFPADWAGAWTLARHMHVGLVTARVCGWVWAQLGATAASGSEALLVDGVPSVRYSVVKGFSAFIRPGSVLVSAAPPAGVYASAWHQVTDSVFTVVLLNTNTTPSAVTLSVPDLSAPKQYQVYRTSQTENCVSLGQILATDSIVLPVQSITTLVGKDSVEQLVSVRRCSAVPSRTHLSPPVTLCDIRGRRVRGPALAPGVYASLAVRRGAARTVVPLAP